MNCANHPDRTVAAFCQNCGKPLCSECVRSVAGQIYDEACLAAKLHGGPTPGATANTGWTTVEGGDPVQRAYQWSVQQGSGPGVSPALAGWLGIIPGVAAMYNGQFVKALVHVLVFVFLIGLTKHFDLAGILIAAWVIYQIFDGIQTAIARRDGLPLPDPFGLNDLGQRLGMPAVRPAAATPPPVQPVPPVASVEGAPAGVPGPDPASPPYAPGAYAAVPTPLAGTPYVPTGRPEPIGAIVLIAVGVLFLLSTLGVFEADWIGRGWPVIVILIGIWLLVSRLRAARSL